MEDKNQVQKLFIRPNNIFLNGVMLYNIVTDHYINAFVTVYLAYFITFHI